MTDGKFLYEKGSTMMNCFHCRASPREYRMNKIIYSTSVEHFGILNTSVVLCDFCRTNSNYNFYFNGKYCIIFKIIICEPLNLTQPTTKQNKRKRIN